MTAIEPGTPVLIWMRNRRYYVGRVETADDRTIRLGKAGVGIQGSPVLTKATHPVIVSRRDVRAVVLEGDR